MYTGYPFRNANNPPQSPEAAVVQLFEEVKRHKPSVIYIQNVDIWYKTLGESVVKTFTGILRSLPPTDPVLLLGILELAPRDEPNKDMLRDLFGYSSKNQYNLPRPEESARREYFQSVADFMRSSPMMFPEAGPRKKRKLVELAEAPVAKPAFTGPTKEEIKAQKKQDRHTLNMLKLQIQQVMDQIKLKYKKFRTPVIEDSVINYLYDEQNPEVLTTDLGETERQQRLFRPYELDKDDKGVAGLREVASGKFYYNLEIVTIEKRLSNGYYKRPKDFLADIKRLAKDAKNVGDQDRTLKANEMLANVEVDMITIETQQRALVAECEAVYEREQARERTRLEEAQQAGLKGEHVPTIVPNVPPAASNTTTETSGPVMLGEQVPGRPPLLPITPSRYAGSNGFSTTDGSNPYLNNGSGVPSNQQEDSEMHDSQPPNLQEGAGFVGLGTPSQNTQGQRSQKSAHTHIAAGSQLHDYYNSASTTTSGQKTSDRSNRSSGPYSVNTQRSNGTGGDHPDFDMLHREPVGGSQLPDTQEVQMAYHHSSQQSQPQSQPHSLPASQSSQPMAPPQRSTSINALLNDPPAEDIRNSHGGNGEAPPQHSSLIVDEHAIADLHRQMVARSSGLSVEQLEQVMASLMDVIWQTRGEWNRTHVYAAVMKAFNETVLDIEHCQLVLGPSQET